MPVLCFRMFCHLHTHPRTVGLIKTSPPTGNRILDQTAYSSLWSLFMIGKTRRSEKLWEVHRLQDRTSFINRLIRTKSLSRKSFKTLSCLSLAQCFMELFSPLPSHQANPNEICSDQLDCKPTKVGNCYCTYHLIIYGIIHRHESSEISLPVTSDDARPSIFN